MATEERKIAGEESKKYDQLEELLKESKAKDENLISVLHQAQQIFGYLPRRVQIRVAQELDLALSEVYSVVSFYSLFTTTPQGDNKIEVCMGTACYVKGAGEILDKLCDKLDVEPGGTTDDGKFTLEGTRCVGACGMAPVVVINGKVHGRVKPDDVDELLKAVTSDK